MSDIAGESFTVRQTKNHQSLTLPLSDYLVELLVAREDRTGGSGCVFPFEEPRRFVQKVRDESGVQFTIHDLHRTFITVAESLDFSSFTIKALVNHRSNTGNDVTGG